MPTSPSSRPSASQLNKENEKSGVKVTMLGLPDQGLRRRAEEVPRVQRLARRRAAGAQAVLPHRLRRRHAQRPGGAGDQGRRQEGRARRSARKWASWPKKARDGKLEPGRHVGRAASRSLRSAASAGATSRRSSTRRKSRSSASAKSQTEPVWDGKQFQPRLMLPLSLSLGPPRHRRRGGGALQRLPGRRSWRTSAASLL